MSAHRLFLASALPATSGTVVLPLSAEDLHHAAGVLRIRSGELVEVVEPDGDRVWTARVAAVAPDIMSAEILEARASARHPRVTLVQGVAKGEKMDAIVRQAVELGVAEVIPVLTERSIVRLAEDKRVARGERWRRIARSAAEQAHRDAVPPVRDPAPLADVLPVLGGYDACVVLWEEARGAGLFSAAESWSEAADPDVAIVVGPEGGLTAEEVAELQAAGASVVTLGPLVLRTETAALAGVALVTWLLGGLGARDE